MGSKTTTPSRIGHLCLEEEAQGVTVSVSEEAVTSEEEVEYLWRFLGTCRWINHLFMHHRVSAEGGVAAAALEAEGGCFLGGVVVGGEVVSVRVRCCRIDLVWRSGVNTVI